jgi:hypothetical protein
MLKNNFYKNIPFFQSRSQRAKSGEPKLTALNRI